MNGKWMMGAVCLGVFLLLGGCRSSQNQLPEAFEEDEVRQEALQAVEYFNQRDYQSLVDMRSEEMKEAMTAEDFAEACDPYLDEKGEFEEIEKTAVLGNTDKTTGDEYGGVIMVGAYENGKLQFTIGFNEEMEMVQFYIR